MASAVSNVLGIPELLRQILSSLPPLDIVRIQLVCRTWHNLISTSPLLQYRSWLSSSYPGPERVTFADTIPELTWEQKSSLFWSEYEEMMDKQTEYEVNRFLHNVSTHLNPVLVHIIMKHVPNNPTYCFEMKPPEHEGALSYFSFRPDILRDCVKWYEHHKDSQEHWGGMSLYRPDLKSVQWEIPCSDDSGIPVHMGAADGAERLTLKDLMTDVDRLWYRWKDSERETHYLSHDAGECDLDMGFPEHCLESSDEEEDEGENEDKDEDEDDDDDDDEEEEEEEEEGGMKLMKMGVKMSVEEHLEQAIQRACS
jgi:hypothetical protein